MSDLELVHTEALLAELARRSDAMYVAIIPKNLKPGEGPRELTRVDDETCRLPLLGIITAGQVTMAIQVAKSTTNRPFEEGDPG